jgi:hypothetical protein
MQETKISSLPRTQTDRLLMAIPFFKEVQDSEPWQYDILLQYSRIVSFDPGEVIIAKGDVDNWVYYVLKGNLVVYPGSVDDRGDAVNEITPGEGFGELAMLDDGKRMATVVADEQAKDTQVLGTDFSIFGQLSDMSVLTLKTKLIFYRKLIHGIRWKLEQYKMQHPTHHLAGELRNIKLYLGPKDGTEELEALFGQAKELAALMGQWNREFGSLEPVEEEKEFDPSVIDELDLE